jgi:hypothetical protein
MRDAAGSRIMRIFDLLWAVVIALFAWLVYTNRGSEKVLTAAGSAAFFILV